MKYLVVATHKDTVSFDCTLPVVQDFTIVAETKDKDLANSLMVFYNHKDKYNHCEVHPVMEDEDIVKLLNNN